VVPRRDKVQAELELEVLGAGTGLELVHDRPCVSRGGIGLMAVCRRLTDRVIKTVLLTKNAHFSKADYFASETRDLFGEQRALRIPA
jgi:hypothetical protein